MTTDPTVGLLREPPEAPTQRATDAAPTAERPFHGCPLCHGVLICTFQRPFKEFHCMSCGNWWEWLQSIDLAYTDDRAAASRDLLARFQAGERGPHQQVS